MFLFAALLVALWSNKIIDYNLQSQIDPNHVFNSVILCNNIKFQMIEYLKQNNTIYTYPESRSLSSVSQYNYNFALILLSTIYNMPIITTKQNYFKPFQYCINDIKMLKLKSKLENNPSIDFLLMDYLLIDYLLIEKNNKQFFVDNNNVNLFIRV